MKFDRQRENPATFRFVFGILLAPAYAAVIGGALLLSNICQFLGLLFVYPLSRHDYRRLNYWIATCWWTLLVLWGRHIHRWRIVRTGDALPQGASAIVFCNHVEQPDIPAILDLGYRSGSLGGLKFFVKAPLKWVPGIGWGMQMLNFLFVKRAWSEDAAFVDRMFARLVEYRTPVWILSFPEGTRVKPHKLAKSQEFAKKRGYPVLENVLLPRSKGFVTTMERMRHRVDGVYDLTIAYPQGIPSITQFIRGAIPEVHLHVRRYPIASLSTEPAKLSDWLTDRFVEKDKRLTAFFRDGRFTI